MSNFLKIEDAAELYDAVFMHWQAARELWSLDVHTVVYENLIDDVEGHLKPLLTFLDLEWRTDVLDHVRTARGRSLITTASYSQVTEPIYKRAVGRWLRYRKHLEPVIPKLAPWASMFGYEI